MLAVTLPGFGLAEDYGQATVNPMLLAEQDLAAESRGDVAAALALYRDDAIVQYGGLCWNPCVGKAAIEKELERRVAGQERVENYRQIRIRECRGGAGRIEDRLYRVYAR